MALSLVFRITPITRSLIFIRFVLGRRWFLGVDNAVRPGTTVSRRQDGCSWSRHATL